MMEPVTLAAVVAVPKTYSQTDNHEYVYDVDDDGGHGDGGCHYGGEADEHKGVDTFVEDGDGAAGVDAHRDAVDNEPGDGDAQNHDRDDTVIDDGLDSPNGNAAADHDAEDDNRLGSELLLFGDSSAVTQSPPLLAGFFGWSRSPCGCTILQVRSCVLTLNPKPHSFHSARRWLTVSCSCCRFSSRCSG